MKTSQDHRTPLLVVLYLSLLSSAVALPLTFDGSSATGQAQGTVTEGQNYNPDGTHTQITTTSAMAGGSSTNGGSSINSAHASSGQGLGGTSFSNTGAQSIQPGAFGGGLPGGFHSPGFGFGGGLFGFGGFGGQTSGQAQGQAQGMVTEGQSIGPQGTTSHIVSTGSSAGGSSSGGAPSYSSSHASNTQGPGGTSTSNTGASSVQPGFGGQLGMFGFGGAPFAAGNHFHDFGNAFGGGFAGFGR